MFETDKIESALFQAVCGLAKALSCITGISEFRFMKAASDIYSIVY